MAIEYGTVKFFNGKSDKRFGSIIPDNMTEDEDNVFFHYNNGGFLDKPVEGVEHTIYSRPLRDPKKGDRVAFQRRFKESLKGPSVSVWHYADEYDRFIEAQKRPMTIDEAKELLATAVRKEVYDVTEHKTRIQWKIDDRLVARFTSNTWLGQHSSSSLMVIPTELLRKTTVFRNEDALLLMSLGILGEVSAKVAVVWRSGYVVFMVDPASVRDMTPEEVENFQGDIVQHGGWLNCLNTEKQGVGKRRQVVKILRMIAGAD